MKRLLKALFFIVVATSVMVYGELGWQFRSFFVLYFPWLPEIMLFFLSLVAGAVYDKLFWFLVSVSISSVASIVLTVTIVVSAVENPVYAHMLSYGVVKGSIMLAIVYLVLTSVVGSISVVVLSKDENV